MKKQPIVVAQIMGKWVGGGVEAVVMNYYRNIDRTKIQFDFICDSDSTYIPREEIESLGGKIIIVPPYQKVFKYIKELQRVLKEGKYNIVHSHINSLSVFSLFAAKRAGIKIRIAHSHATTSKKEWKRNIIKNILKKFSKLFANHYIACSTTAGEWLFGKKAMKNGEVYILRNAIDSTKFSYNENTREEIRKSYNIKNNQIVIGHVGRMFETKNHVFLLKIFYEFQKKNDALLMLVGDGKLKEDIKKQAEELNILNKVIFVGLKNNVNDYYQAFDIFILPSLYEGFGMVTIEAQASNLPCIVSDTVPKETKMSNDYCFLNLNSGINIWVDKIHELLIKNNRKDNTSSIIENGFDIRKEAEKIENYYISCKKELK